MMSNTQRPEPVSVRKTSKRIYRLLTQLAERWPHPIDLHVASVETPLFGESAAEDPFLDYLVALSPV